MFVTRAQKIKSFIEKPRKKSYFQTLEGKSILN